VCPRGPTQGLLLDALADQVELGPGQSDNVEGVHHDDRIRDDLGGGGLIAGEPGFTFARGFANRRRSLTFRFRRSER
jgi:hypothetical protein